jgi:alpha-L-rhamnosidase
MLYSGVLESAGNLYHDDILLEKGLKLKNIISKQSFNGRFFVDNAVRKDGKLVLTTNTTEVCQYYAFFFNIATYDKYPELLKILLRDFGPQRKETGMHPDVPFANAFIGNYLRLEVLFRNGFNEQLLKEIDGYFYYMAVLSRSLWEYDTPKASCCHGFASYVAYWLLNLREQMNL